MLLEFAKCDVVSYIHMFLRQVLVQIFVKKRPNICTDIALICILIIAH